MPKKKEDIVEEPKIKEDDTKAGGTGIVPQPQTEEEFEDDEEDEEKKLKENDEEEEDIEKYLNKLFEKKKEGLKMVRVFREVEIQTPNPTTTPPIAENPVGNVPGEDKYVGKEVFEERMGRVEEGIRKIGSEIGKLKSRIEGSGETRGTEEPAGPIEPRPMPTAENLSQRKTIVGGGLHKESFNVRKGVKEFLKTQGGVM